MHNPKWHSTSVGVRAFVATCLVVYAALTLSLLGYNTLVLRAFVAVGSTSSLRPMLQPAAWLRYA